MDNFYVAKSYQSYEKLGEPFEKNGKLYIKVKDICDRCGGTGRLNHFGHIDGGMCYKCRGGGWWSQDVRAYSQKEYEALERRNQRAAEKKAQELEERKKNAQAKWYEANGFNKDGITYMLVGNTFSIKDELKEKGWKFNNFFKWHGSEPITDYPEFPLISIDFNDIAKWNYENMSPEYNMDADEVINRSVQQALPPSMSNFIGEVGERLYEVPVTYSYCYGYDTRFGYNQVFNFKTEDDNIIKWATGTNQQLEVGEKIFLTGTVKEHKTYNGENYTVLTRCKITKGV